jgi:diguanylate cyclase (GGDEF)-like protein
MDVDRFKRVNDSLGHGVGDQLLQSIGRRLVAGVRNSDTVSRYGGDEFVVLLSEVAHARDVVISARKIVAIMGPTHRVGDIDLHATVSVGISVYPLDGTDAETLLNNADMALIHAKNRGAGKYQFFEKI